MPVTLIEWIRLNSSQLSVVKFKYKIRQYQFRSTNYQAFLFSLWRKKDRTDKKKKKHSLSETWSGQSVWISFGRKYL